MQAKTGRQAALKHMQTSNFLALLRRETGIVHERLHVHPLTAPLLSPNLTREHYIHVLQAFYGFHKPLEAKVRPYRPVSRAGWIERDLESLGCDIDIALCFELPEINTEAALFGYWYVVEGSSLGSAMIYKHLQKHLGLDAKTGARFFYAYERDTGEYWKVFLGFLAEQDLDEQEQAEAASAALGTFLCLEKWLWRYHRRYS